MGGGGGWFGDLLRFSVGSRGVVLGGCKGAKPPEAESSFFLNPRYENPLFLTLYPVSNNHSQNTLYCDLRLSSRGTNQAQTKVSI